MKIMIDIPEQIYQNAKDDMLCGSELIVNAIKKGTPIEPKTGWIPVSERLPKEDGEYLVTEDDVVMTLAYSSKHVWYYNDGEHYQEFDDVTAWMVLPEPYKEG